MGSIGIRPLVGKIGALTSIAVLATLGLSQSVAVSAGDGPIQIRLTPSADTTLFEEGDLSNGGGQRLFTGRINTGPLRRALVQFDLSSLPPGSTIEDVELTMNMSRTISGTLNVSLYRLTNEWGEGTVDAGGQEGGGDAAEIGDATWMHRHYPTVFWDTPGGDYVATASATTPIFNALGSYHWQGDGMVTDVENWINDPSSNFGWILVSSENPTNGTAKRFDSRENGDVDTLPVLTITLQRGAALPIPTTSWWAALAMIALLLFGATTSLRRQRRLN